jgi:hypothetical protein
MATYGSSQREIALIGTCSPHWSRLTSDEDLWAAMRIEENRTLKINNFIPADIAVVGGEYFIGNEEPMLILATRRERVETIEGLARAEVRNIRPRVLLNADHIMIRSIERVVGLSERAGLDLRLALEYLIAGVLEEKTKGRRARRLKSVMATLTAIGER